MKMHRLEKLMVNTPARALFQRLVPTPFFLKHSRLSSNPLCLEIGCGQGAGGEIILEKFNARRVIAIDYDTAQVKLAQKHIRSKYRPNLQLLTGDAASLSFVSARFDAVFDYGILHHVPGWRKALAEIFRVLKPNGQFFYEEMLETLIGNYVFDKLFPHPPEALLTQQEFEQALIKQGFKLCGSRQRMKSYLIGVAQK
jgi:ubiquinone/menaquinone biosynthesis C-methylase UbiE